MSQETIIELIVEVLLFLIASYFIFYRSWLKSLGKEMAKLSTAKDLTSIQETVKNEFKESIESYKSKLSVEVQTEIEPLKAELEKQNLSHQIQYSFLHKERAKVIVELYKKLQELQSAMADWTKFMHPIVEDGGKESEERAQRANNALFDFKNYFILNKIFFSEEFCKPIDDLIQVYWDKGWDFGYAKNRIKEGNLPRDYFKEYSEQLTRISKELKELIPPRIADIESLCRKILVVEENKNT